MSRIILFSDYLDHSDKTQVLNSVSYIGTREGVELNKETLIHKFDQPLDPIYQNLDPTEGQKVMITELAKHEKLKDTYSYHDYIDNPNMYTASSFICESVQYFNEIEKTNEAYLKYISERPGVEKNKENNHGLFDATGDADLKSIQSQLVSHHGNVWRDIISLRREDALETGYDNQAAWKTLLQAKMPQLATNMKIPIENFRWCAAFHDESYHPHVHIMMWDAKAKEGFKNQEAITKFKSACANEIFSNEMYLHKELKTIYSNEMRTEFEKKIDMIVTSKTEDIIEETKDSVLEDLESLAKECNDFGKRIYGFQSAEAKLLCDKIVGDIVANANMKPLLVQYLKEQKMLCSFYKKESEGDVEKMLQRLIHPTKDDKKVLHNLVIKAAYEIKDINLKEKIVSDEQLNPLLEKIKKDEKLATNSYTDRAKLRVYAMQELKYPPSVDQLIEFDKDGTKDNLVVNDETGEVSLNLEEEEMDKLLTRYYTRQLMGKTERMYTEEQIVVGLSDAKNKELTESDKAIAHDTYIPHKLTNSIMKLCIANEMTNDQILDLVKDVPEFKNEEYVLESILENRDKKIRTEDIKLLNRIYDAKLIFNYDYQPNRIHTVSKLISNIVSLMSSETMENQRELHRLFKVRRMDEIQLKRSLNK